MENIGTHGEFEFKQTMIEYENEFNKITDCLSRLTTSQQEEMLIFRLKYVLTRGFREFSMLYDLKP